MFVGGRCAGVAGKELCRWGSLDEKVRELIGRGVKDGYHTVADALAVLLCPLNIYIPFQSCLMHRSNSNKDLELFPHLQTVGAASSKLSPLIAPVQGPTTELLARS